MAQMAIELIVVAILAIFVLFVGIQAITGGKGLIGDLFSTGKNVNFGPGTIVEACEQWVSAGDRLEAKAILDSYKIADRLNVYSLSCARSLKEAAQAVISQCAKEPQSARCNAGQLTFADASKAVTACNAITQIESLCSSQLSGASQSQVNLCVDCTLKRAGSDVCSGEVPSAASIRTTC